MKPLPPEPANSPPRPPAHAVDPVQLNSSKLYPLPTNNPASGRSAVPLENNTDKPPSTGPCFGADPTTFAEGPDTTPAGTTPAGTTPAGTTAPNNAFGVGTTATGTGTETGTPPVPVAAGATLTAAGTGTGGSPDRADREPVPGSAAAWTTPPRTTPSRTTPSARTADAGPAIPSSAPAAEPRTAPAEPRPGAPPPRRGATGPLAAAAEPDDEESADLDPEESPRPPSA